MALTSVVTERCELFPLPAKLTVTNLPQLSPELSRTVQENPFQHLALDLSHVDTIDSSFLRLCVNLQKRKKEQGKELYVINPSQVVQQVLQDTNLDRVIPIFPNERSLEERLSESFRRTYEPFSIEIDGGILVPSLRCPVCSSQLVSAYLVDLAVLQWEWPGTDPFPVGRDPATEEIVDTLALQPIVCQDCFFASLDITQFDVLNGKDVAMRTNLTAEEIHQLSKSIKKRRKMMQVGVVLGDHFFDWPRDSLAVYRAYRLAEDCMKTRVNRESANDMFMVGYLNYAAIRYSPPEVRDELVSNCRSWLSRAVSTEPPALPVHRARGYLILVVSALNLEKTQEVTLLWDDFGKMMHSLERGESDNRIDNPWFWYDQCERILDDSRSRQEVPEAGIWHAELKPKGRNAPASH